MIQQNDLVLMAQSVDAEKEKQNVFSQDCQNEIGAWENKNKILLTEIANLKV